MDNEVFWWYKKYELGGKLMTKKNGLPIKVSQEFKDFIDNIRATRRCNTIGIDKKMLTQIETGDLIVKYFKLNNNIFTELIKLKIEKDV